MRYLKVFLLFFGLVHPLASQAGSNALDVRFPVTKYQLKNGMTVLLFEDHSAPIISYHTWFRVGSKNETPGATGLAHLFEHMMFKGTKKYGNKEFDLLMQKNGITNNAFTTRDYTAYYENLPSGKLELVMDIEADRMRNLIIDEKQLKSEREVVKEERRQRVENQPMGELYEALYHTLYKVSPYRWPVIGYMTDLDALTVEKCKEFYDTYYAPNNAVLVIGGDFETETVKKWVEKKYGPIASSPLPPLDFPKEPEQKAMRSSKVYRPIEAESFALSFKAAKIESPDNHALDLLGAILGEGDSSRLHHSLVYKNQLASNVYAYNAGAMEGGTFNVLVNLKPGVSASRAEKLIWKELLEIGRKGIQEKELQKAVNLTQSNYVRGLKTIEGKVKALAVNEVVFGDYNRLFSDLSQYSEVKKGDVQKVVNQYLTKKNSVLVRVLPGKEEGDKK